VNRALSAIPVLAIGAVLAVSGCGGGGGDSSDSGGAYGGRGQTGSTQAATNESSGAGGAGTVAVADNPEHGALLVNAEGFTLYDFHKDKGGKSSCYDACASTWPPLTTEGAPQAIKGAMAAKLGTTKRTDGTIQVTYAGWPLYTYAADTKPGDANGQDIDSFGAEWYALQPSGAEVED
jgi:predicted lipoprotein with Yx(FWY)xxD motif